MQYDDETRRFNLLGGLACGAVLGAGLALLLGPKAKKTDVGRAAHRLTRRTKRSLARAADRAESLAGDARAHLRRRIDEKLAEDAAPPEGPPRRGRPADRSAAAWRRERARG